MDEEYRKLVNGLGAIIDEAERGFLSIDDLRQLHEEMDDLSCVIVTTPNRNQIVNELIHSAKAIGDGAEDPTILHNIEKMGLELTAIDDNQPFQKNGVYVDSTDGPVFVTDRCTTLNCFKTPMLTPFSDEERKPIYHPSGLCHDCYRTHKQDLRDGKELIE